MKRKKMRETENKCGKMLLLREPRQRSYVYCSISTS